ncbi:MAG: HalOD1 output domain-containing protein, partial [Haloferacaceae archaeon]
TDEQLNSFEPSLVRAEATKDDLIMTIVEAVSRLQGVSSRELTPLVEAINPDALERLFSDSLRGDARESGYVTFPYAGCQVTVHADGEVVVTYGE